MPKFNRASLVEAFGTPSVLYAELVTNQKSFFNVSLTDDSGAPLSLTGATIDVQIVRRQFTAYSDSRSGVKFTIIDYPGTASPISLMITNRMDALGQFTILLDSSTWNILITDDELDINADLPVAFSGRIKTSFPQAGLTPAYDQIEWLLFSVRSDGILN